MWGPFTGGFHSLPHSGSYESRKMLNFRLKCHCLCCSGNQGAWDHSTLIALWLLTHTCHTHHWDCHCFLWIQSWLLYWESLPWERRQWSKEIVSTAGCVTRVPSFQGLPQPCSERHCSVLPSLWDVVFILLWDCKRKFVLQCFFCIISGSVCCFSLILHNPWW